LRGKKATSLGFASPTALPDSDERERRWQQANREWWENHPMRYDWREALSQPEFLREFYQEIDRRFLSSVARYMPWHEIPFDPLIDFAALRHMDVLEIGVGSGTVAQLLAQHAKRFVGIDITHYAVTSTSRRLQLQRSAGQVLQMDAEKLALDDASFDFVWSWGVIHHSANTRKILHEIHRVLRPGGRATLMVYHRNAWNTLVLAGLAHGVFRGRLLKRDSLHTIMQEMTDGAIARYYSKAEWTALVSSHFDLQSLRIYGLKSDVVPLPAGRFKDRLMTLMPDAWSRFLTNTCQLGSFLVSTLRRPA
jgi:ubiquinone/menaquinone biosynthesis C-methylase UbiE